MPRLLKRSMACAAIARVSGSKPSSRSACGTPRVGGRPARALGSDPHRAARSNPARHGPRSPGARASRRRVCERRARSDRATRRRRRARSATRGQPGFVRQKGREGTLIAVRAIPICVLGGRGGPVSRARNSLRRLDNCPRHGSSNFLSGEAYLDTVTKARVTTQLVRRLERLGFVVRLEPRGAAPLSTPHSLLPCRSLPPDRAVFMAAGSLSVVPNE
jgi:hypothetical protein